MGGRGSTRISHKVKTCLFCMHSRGSWQQPRDGRESICAGVSPSRLKRKEKKASLRPRNKSASNWEIGGIAPFRFPSPSHVIWAKALNLLLLLRFSLQAGRKVTTCHSPRGNSPPPPPPASWQKSQRCRLGLMSRAAAQRGKSGVQSENPATGPPIQSQRLKGGVGMRAWPIRNQTGKSWRWRPRDEDGKEETQGRAAGGRERETANHERGAAGKEAERNPTLSLRAGARSVAKIASSCKSARSSC